MKKSTMLFVCVLCALMLVVGFAPSYIDYIYPQAANLSALEVVFLPAVAAAENPPLPEDNSCYEYSCGCNSSSCGEDCGCVTVYIQP